MPIGVGAQQAVIAALVFDEVTVVDVEQGKLVPGQRVVIQGNRIEAVGNATSVKVPKGAQVVNVRGKYLIPGLWDLHTHVPHLHSLLLATGVTGIRNAGSFEPSLDTLLRWRREILAGTRIGPPRQILSGSPIHGIDSPINPGECTAKPSGYYICIPRDSAGAQRLVDSLKAAGVDMLKAYNMSRPTYFALAAAARRAGIPFGGHLMHNRFNLDPRTRIPQVDMLPAVTAAEATDSGARIIDHYLGDWTAGCLDQPATVEQCAPLAERFRSAGTWWVPTFAVDPNPGHLGSRSMALDRGYQQRLKEFWAGSLLHGNWLRDSSAAPGSDDSTSSGFLRLRIARRANLPIAAGTDAGGFAIHLELAIYVEEGLTSLEALQAATLNPAKMWGATDSLGTVAPGKLADLVLLDADPLADITNTTTIRAVVANGRYFDRAALDQLLREAQTDAKRP